MARRKIREFDAKRLLFRLLSAQSGTRSLFEEYNGVLVTPHTDLAVLANVHPWLLSGKLVVKPDQLFGKRKKHGLVLVGGLFDEVCGFIRQQRGKEIVVDGVHDVLTHFLIEPFVAHDNEYYLAFRSEREHDEIIFSDKGGIDIEENWDNIKTLRIATLDALDRVGLGSLTDDARVQSFISGLFDLFRKLDFTSLEFNPFAVVEGRFFLLDCVAEVDDCASFKQMKDWQGLEFPVDFGKKIFPEETVIDEMNRKSGSAIKLTMLNPQGEIWTILAGGGASIIYLDMIANLGKGGKIANYSDISGNTMEESYYYAKTVLELMTRHNGKVLFIAGGIANFTDVKETYAGFAKAISEYAPVLKQQGISIYIRRGGPHYEEGLAIMKRLKDESGLSMQVHGPEMSMPKIIQIAQEKW